MDFLQIEKVIGREIIDSRGNPTVEAEVLTAGLPVNSPFFLKNEATEAPFVALLPSHASPSCPEVPLF